MADASSLELEPASEEVKRYQREKITSFLIRSVLSLALLALFAFWWGPTLGNQVREFLGENPWLRLFGILLVLGVSLEALSLPFDFYSGYILEHRYQLSNQTFGKWLWKRLKSYLVGGILGLMLLYGLYALVWAGGPYWWLWATLGYLVLSLVLGRLLPILILPLFYKTTRLTDSALLERLQRLAQGTGLTVEGVYRLHLSEETKKANAALAGLGKSRRVLLGDTLLDHFTPEEIEVVFAHEVGHHVYKHLPISVAISVVLSLLGFWLVDRLLTQFGVLLGYEGLIDPAALPLLLFILTVLGLMLSPAQNALSRVFEVQCDTYALKRTRRPQAFRSAFVKLARLNKSDPDPHPLVAWLFYDHPPIRQRLALSDLVVPLDAREVR